MGLDDSIYGTVLSNILSIEPLPNLNWAYIMVVQEEWIRNIPHGKELRNGPMAFILKIKSTLKGRFENKYKSVVYLNCKKIGHITKFYFQLIGYP